MPTIGLIVFPPQGPMLPGPTEALAPPSPMH